MVLEETAIFLQMVSATLQASHLATPSANSCKPWDQWSKTEPPHLVGDFNLYQTWLANIEAYQALVPVDFRAHTEAQLPAITGIHPSKVLAISLFGSPNTNIKNRNTIQWNI